MPRFRCTIRRMMIAVAVVALIAWAYSAWQEWTLNGAFTSILSNGQLVATRFTIDRGDPDRWSIAGGTSCLVLQDYAVDEDDCTPSRPIHVRILEGPHKNKITDINRDELRHKR
jgi:hypothetical protein